jgi:uncharacterized protein (TIGR02145 family)
MKKLLLFSLISLKIAFVAFAQQVTVSFLPKNDSDQIDSVHVTNLTKEQTVKLNAGEAAVFTMVTSIEDIAEYAAPNGFLYPNPFHDNTTLTFNTYEFQKVSISTYSAFGQSLCSRSYNLYPGNHSFRLQFPASGLYHVVVKENKKPLSYKAVSLGKNKTANIQYSGNQVMEEINNPFEQFKSAQNEKLLDYSEEDVVHYTVFSGENTTVIADEPKTSKTIVVEFYQCKDPDDRNYKIVKIGFQWWMAENLGYLPEVSPASSRSGRDRHYYVFGYNGNDTNTAKTTDNYRTYGVLYNWPAAMDGSESSDANPSGIRGVCPAGWHLPSDAEWTQLENFLADNGYNYDGASGGGREKIAKSLASNNHWRISSSNLDNWGDIGYNLSANNRSGFSALPGGYFSSPSYSFGSIVDFGAWWSSTESNSFGQVWIRELKSYYHFVYRTYEKPEYGFSVRCVRN